MLSVPVAIVWSYFHALRESGSEMAKHFVIIAPNLTVFERLKEDFRPEGGGPDIFMTDPLVPPEWRGDWNFAVVLQDEASGASTGGILYLTNIHRLFETRNGSRSDVETYDWAGPAVSKSKALDIGAELRDRITSHPRIMVLNDEALPLGSKGEVDVVYEGRHLITDEVIEVMNISLPLLQNGATAISFYVRELEAACKVQSTHPVLAPLLQTFLSEILFSEKVGLFDKRLTGRLADQDVREHIRAVFIPLIRARTVRTEKRRSDGAAIQLRNWKPYQATLSERKPVEKAKHTLFNLVPCDQSLEVAMTSFLDNCADVAAFAKNAGPQALRIDYLTADQRLAFYRPDFFVRMDSGEYALVETKGRQDSDVPRKAIAAIEWCKAASKGTVKWQYVFTPQNVMERLTGNRFADLARACAPALQNLLSETTSQPELPLFGPRSDDDAEKFFGNEIFDALPLRAKKAATDALELYRFFERKTDAPNFAPVFSALLGPFDEVCKAAILTRLQPSMPATAVDQRDWFEPYMPNLDKKKLDHYNNMAKNLKRGLVYGNPHSVIGLLRSCLDYALNDTTKIDGVFSAVSAAFRFDGSRTLFEKISAVNEFRNNYVAHGEKELRDSKVAEQNLRGWVTTLAAVAER
ncbi:hypothetical protein [Agrobacterium pusense]|uniref:hypothetical protein n=1 Tax=Agrobacterium pusense TaxID=648995 RepID=UPI002447B10D|nr:hypothetical protein [Agrobacterium pusense]MDH0869448.1 hypothetical protein [Agrobacterium pusense]MDH1267136.1 hypothetical protein [Agrobacterium pusense]